MATKKRMIPYSVYLPADLYNKLKKAGKNRQASTIVRQAIGMILDDSDAFKTGYQEALKHAANIVAANPHACLLHVDGQDLGSILVKQILALKG